MDLPDGGRILARFLDELVSDEMLFPLLDLDGTVAETYCNIGARRCSPGEKFHEFDKDYLLAEDMGRIMQINDSGGWRAMSGAEAALWAMTGRRAMAFMSREQMNSEHAHIARVYPRAMAISGSLNMPVPFVANIGKGNPREPMRSISFKQNTRPNWVCKASEAFPVRSGECLYYGWQR